MNLYNNLDNFINYLTAERGASRHTIEAYNRDILHFIKYLEDNSLDVFQRENAEKYMGYLKETGKKTRSIVRAFSAVRSFFNFLIADGIIKNNPLEDVDIPKYQPPIPDVLSEQEMVALIEQPCGSRTSLRDKTILELLYATGLRVSELIQLKKSDVNLEGGFIIASGKRSKERVVPIGEYSKQAIIKYIEEEKPKGVFLFPNSKGTMLTRQAIWKLIKKYSSKIDKYNVSPHTIRHTFATHILEGGADLRSVQVLLGHEDISTTQIYTHVDKKRLKEVHKKFHPRG